MFSPFYAYFVPYFIYTRFHHSTSFWYELWVRNHISILVFTNLRPFFTIFWLELRIYTLCYQSTLILYHISIRTIHLYSFSLLYAHLTSYFGKNYPSILIVTHPSTRFHTLFWLEIKFLYSFPPIYATFLNPISVRIMHMHSVSPIYVYSTPYFD